MERASIRIRLIARVQDSDVMNPREAFWLSMGHENGNYDALEGKLCNEFGPALRNLLIEHFSEPLRDADRKFFRGEFGDLDHFLFRYFDRPRKEKDWWQGQELDAIARIYEQRQQFFNENPAIRATIEKIAATSPIIFAVRIAGYSSINLDLSVGSIKKVAEIFDGDFDSFRVFLEAFVPQAYARVFSSSDAERLDCAVQIPNTFARAFSATMSPSSPAVLPEQQISSLSPTSAREKAEWLWRLANGSLLVPVILSLAVMYLGMTMLRDIGKSQQTMMAPIFEHQMKLLEEDRHRLFKEVAPTPAPSSSPASTSPTSPK